MPFSCVFEFDRTTEIYYSGEIITGLVKLRTTEEKRCSEVNIEFLGKAKTYWEEHNSRQQNLECFSGQETYIEACTTVFSGKKLYLGKHVYTFRIPIPVDVPSSCIERYGCINYEILLVIKQPMGNDIVFRKPMTILKSLNLNLSPEYLLPQKDEEMKNFDCWICSSGSVIFSLRTSFGGYAPGQNIKYNIKIDSRGTSHHFKDINMKLIQTYEFTALKPRHKKRSYSITLADVAHDEIIFPSNKRNLKGALFMPPAPPSSPLEFISVTYHVEMNIRKVGTQKRLKLSVPVTIGTIPLFISIANTETQPLTMSTIEKSGTTGYVPQIPSNHYLIKPPFFEEVKSITTRFVDMDIDEKNRVESFIPKYPMYTDFTLPLVPSTTTTTAPLLGVPPPGIAVSAIDATIPENEAWITPTAPTPDTPGYNPIKPPSYDLIKPPSFEEVTSVTPLLGPPRPGFSIPVGTGQKSSRSTTTSICLKDSLRPATNPKAPPYPITDQIGLQYPSNSKTSDAMGPLSFPTRRPSDSQSPPYPTKDLSPSKGPPYATKDLRISPSSSDKTRQPTGSQGPPYPTNDLSQPKVLPYATKAPYPTGDPSGSQSSPYPTKDFSLSKVLPYASKATYPTGELSGSQSAGYPIKDVRSSQSSSYKTRDPSGLQGPPYPTNDLSQSKVLPYATKAPYPTGDPSVSQSGPYPTKGLSLSKVLPYAAKAPYPTGDLSGSESSGYPTKNLRSSPSSSYKTKDPSGSQSPPYPTNDFSQSKGLPYATKAPYPTGDPCGLHSLPYPTKDLSPSKSPPYATKDPRSSQSSSYKTRVPSSSQDLPYPTNDSSQLKGLPRATKAPYPSRDPSGLQSPPYPSKDLSQSKVLPYAAKAPYPTEDPRGSQSAPYPTKDLSPSKGPLYATQNLRSSPSSSYKTRDLSGSQSPPYPTNDLSQSKVPPYATKVPYPTEDPSGSQSAPYPKKDLSQSKVLPYATKDPYPTGDPSCSQSASYPLKDLSPSKGPPNATKDPYLTGGPSGLQSAPYPTKDLSPSTGPPYATKAPYPTGGPSGSQCPPYPIKDLSPSKGPLYATQNLRSSSSSSNKTRDPSGSQSPPYPINNLSQSKVPPYATKAPYPTKDPSGSQSAPYPTKDLSPSKGSPYATKAPYPTEDPSGSQSAPYPTKDLSPSKGPPYGTKDLRSSPISSCKTRDPSGLQGPPYPTKDLSQSKVLPHATKAQKGSQSSSYSTKRQSNSKSSRHLITASKTESKVLQKPQCPMTGQSSSHNPGTLNTSLSAADSIDLQNLPNSRKSQMGSQTSHNLTTVLTHPSNLVKDSNSLKNPPYPTTNLIILQHPVADTNAGLTDPNIGFIDHVLNPDKKKSIGWKY